MKKRKRNRGELNFWQPSSDLMTGLVLILILIIILLLLYLMYTPESANGDLTNGTTESTNDYDGYGSTESAGEGNTWNQRGDSYDDGSGNGTNEISYGGGGTGIGDDVGILPGFDEGVKSAVYVEVVDAETGKVIKKEGITFSLYSGSNELEILNTYYPVKIAYKQYETTEDGTFYLPEKIYEGKYSLKELTVPEGYDSADSVSFTVDKLYDWPNPLVVQVPLSPSRNCIQVQMTDADLGTNVGGAAFDVIAAEDIATKDGTVRFKKGETVDTITLDEEGFGKSKELYLGKYTLKQTVVPEYYAAVSSDISVSVEQKTGVDAKIVEAKVSKTAISITLTDELTGEPLTGSEFEITDVASGEKQNVTTDQNGKITLTDLEKNTSYSIQQVSTAEHYKIDSSEHTFGISSYGKIKGKTSASLKLTNRMLRVQVGAEDRALHKEIAGKSLTLKDSNGNEVASWTSSDSPRTFTDLKEGTYELFVDDQEEAVATFTVEDTAQIQNFHADLITGAGVLTLIGIGTGVVLIIALLTTVLRKLRKRKANIVATEEKSSDPNDKE